MSLTKVSYSMINGATANVLDYGVSTSASAVENNTAFQAALDSGFDLFIPKGNYSVAGLFTVTTAGQTIRGEGVNSILTATVPTNNLFTLQAANISISDMRLNGCETAAAITTASFAIFTDAAIPAINAKIERVMVSGANSALGFNHAFKFDTGCNYNLVNDCWIERLQGQTNGGYGVLAGQCTGILVTHSKFFGTPNRGRHAVYFSAGCIGCIASENFITGFNYEAMTLNVYGYSGQNASTDCEYVNNVIVNCGVAFGSATSGGISSFGSSIGLKLIGNTITNCNCSGIHLEGIVTLNVAWVTGTAYIRGSTVSNGGVNYVCVIPHTSGTFATDVTSRYWINDCAENVISGNVISGNNYFGININSYSYGSITGNIVQNNGTAGTYTGVRLLSNGTFPADRWTISGNSLIGNTNYGVELNATAPVPTGTVISGNGISANTAGSIKTNNIAAVIDGSSSWATFADGATTPSVAFGNKFVCTNSGATVITNFTNGTDGQEITLRFSDANTTITQANAALAGGVNFVSSASDMLTLVYRASGTIWFEKCRSIN